MRTALCKVLARSTAAFALVLVASLATRGGTPKFGPISGCSSPPSNFQVVIGFDTTNNVPTVSAAKNTNCLTVGDTVAFQINPTANITSWDVQFPTTNPLFPGTCPFGTTTSQPSQSCVVITGAAEGDYTYVVDVYIGGSPTKYTLDPRVIIRDSGKRKRHRHEQAKAESAAGL